MKNYISAAVLAVVLGSSSFAYAVLPTPGTQGPGSTNTVLVPPTGGSTTTTTPAAGSVNPTADIGTAGTSDYRLSCPSMTANGTAMTATYCRTLTKPPSPSPY